MTTIDTMAAGLPLYVHPLTDSRSWSAMATAETPVRFVVVNQDSGPGSPEDVDLSSAAHAATAAGTQVCGYVDCNGGAVVDFTLVQNATAWVGRAITGLFVDRVPTTPDKLQAFGVSLLRMRTAGMRYVVLNPGAVPDPGYMDLADVVVTFEGSMADYRTLTVPDWLADYAPERMAHLIYEATVDDVDEAVNLARQRGVHNVYVTDKLLSSGNPWAGVPSFWASLTRSLQRYPSRPAPLWIADLHG